MLNREILSSDTELYELPNKCKHFRASRVLLQNDQGFLVLFMKRIVKRTY